MKRKKKCCIGYKGRCGICIRWYSIFDTEDYKRYQEHEDRIRKDVENLGKEKQAEKTGEDVKLLYKTRLNRIRII